MASDKATPDPFYSLLQALEPHIDDIVRKPKFHVFMKLPLELRYTIYEEYFHADTKSTACKAWPRLAIDRTQQFITQHLMKAAPFLPSLCFVSRALRAEVTAFLVGSMTLDIAEPLGMKMLFKMLDRPQLRHGFDWTASIHKLVLSDVNGCYFACLCSSSGGTRPQELSAREEIAYACQSLSRFSGVRELELRFHAPMVNAVDGSWTFDYQAAAIDPFLRGLGLRHITALPELQRVRVTGVSGYQGGLEAGVFGSVGEDGTTLKDDTVEKLEGVVTLGRQVKDAFREEGRQVDVRARLLWSDQCDERVL